MVHVIRDDKASLASLIQQSGAQIIAIDGVDGAGKTYLADRLAEQIGGTVIDADTYLEKHEGYFIRALLQQPMQQAVEDARRAGKKVFLSGVCMFDILELLSADADFVVYVELRDWRTDRPDNSIILDFEDDSLKIDMEQLGLNDLDTEICLYLRRVKPRSCADAIYLRTVNRD